MRLLMEWVCSCGSVGLCCLWVMGASAPLPRTNSFRNSLSSLLHSCCLLSFLLFQQLAEGEDERAFFLSLIKINLIFSSIKSTWGGMGGGGSWLIGLKTYNLLFRNMNWVKWNSMEEAINEKTAHPSHSAIASFHGLACSFLPEWYKDIITVSLANRWNWLL